MIAPEVVLFMCCAVAVCSETCFPAQAEWQQFLIAGFADKQHHTLKEEFDVVSYDAINNRTAVLATLQSGQTVYRLKVITIFDHSLSGKQYVVDLATGRCQIYPMHPPFASICISDDAQRIGTLTLGLSSGLNLTGYEISHANPRNIALVQEIDGNTCVPVSEAVYGELGHSPAGVMETLDFFNFTLGIKNVSVFDIPAECKHAEESTFPEQRIRHHRFTMAI